MKNILEHFIWNDGDGEYGRIAVKIESNTLELVQIVGPAPTPHIIPTVFSHHFLLWEEAVSAHRSRAHRFAVEKREGMSGCDDFLLRIERDARIGDHPIVARLHISMYGKLNQGFRACLGDCPPLFEAAGLTPPSSSIQLEEVSIFQPVGGLGHGDPE